MKNGHPLSVSGGSILYIFKYKYIKIEFHEQLFRAAELRAHILAVIIVIIVIDETVNTVSAYFKDNNMSNSSQLQ